MWNIVNDLKDWLCWFVIQIIKGILCALLMIYFIKWRDFEIQGPPPVVDEDFQAPGPSTADPKNQQKK